MGEIHKEDIATFGGSLAFDTLHFEMPKPNKLYINMTNSAKETVEEFVHRFTAIVINVDGEEFEYSPEQFIDALEWHSRSPLGTGGSTDEL